MSLIVVAIWSNLLQTYGQTKFHYYGQMILCCRYAMQMYGQILYCKHNIVELVANTVGPLNKGHVGDNINSLVLSFVEGLSSSRRL